MLSKVALLTLLLAASCTEGGTVAHAPAESARTQGNPAGDAFSASQLGVSAAVLTTNPNFTINSRGYGAVTVYVALTYGAASSLNLACSAGNAGSVFSPVGVSTVASSGAITMADAAWAYPTGGASRRFRFVVGPLNDAQFSCVISGTGATTDTVTATAFGS